MSFDSIVIGGGVMGSSVALRLAQGGQRVLVLERSVPGAEASSAAGGILGPQMEGDPGGPLFALALRSREAYPAFAEELHALSGVDIAFRRCGLLQVAMEGEDVSGLDRRLSLQREAGLPIERLDGAGARALEPGLSERVSAALHFPEEGRVDPKALARAVALAAKEAGATFRTGQVRRVLVEGRQAVGVQVDEDRIAAGAVIVAAGAWTCAVEGVPLAKDAIEPLRGQMVEVAPPAAPLAKVVFSSAGYLVPRDDGRIVAGSTMERAGYDKRVTAGGLARILDQAIRTLPGLEGSEVIAHWSGLRPAPKDGLPLIGATATERLWICSGHHRNGILLTPTTAALLASSILSGVEEEALAPFSPKRSI